MNVLVSRRRRVRDPYRRVPNLNLVPQELRPISRGPVSALALLAVIVAVALALTSYRSATENRQLNSTLEAQLRQMQVPVTEARAILNDAAAIRKEIEDLRAQAGALQGDLLTLKDRKATWSPLLAHIVSNQTPDVAVKALSFDSVKATVSISGQSKGVDKLLAYQDTLIRSPMVSNVSEFRTSPIPDLPGSVAFDVVLQLSSRVP